MVVIFLIVISYVSLPSSSNADYAIVRYNNEIVKTMPLSVDDDFRKLFKIKVEFADDAPLNKENANKLARFVHTFCEKEKAPHFQDLKLGLETPTYCGKCDYCKSVLKLNKILSSKEFEPYDNSEIESED